ncbi:MAG: tRNA (adenosine(37)-N6)-threonylcarbamoyltransferase complex ATPase subunit type 1 TsaE [Burkholderia sp.]|nr:MAG: tRNA threonylcarbamoyladenosine biosynthesis protein TsaE [Burkholderia gladioli]
MPAQPSHPIHAIVPSAPLTERQFAFHDEAAIVIFGLRFAQALDAMRAECLALSAFEGLQIQLRGELGTGKTTLVRAILHGLGHAGRVRSPTYTLVEPYVLERADGELVVHHFDLYRFSDPVEWVDAGLREYFNVGAICLVEWPQQAGTLLGMPDLVFALNVDGEGRRLVAQAHSALGNVCLERY